VAGRLRRLPTVGVEVDVAYGLQEGQEAACSVDHLHELCVTSVESLGVVSDLEDGFGWIQGCSHRGFLLIISPRNIVSFRIK
jgi:hypothetical protein